jgi:hypothetical protein
MVHEANLAYDLSSAPGSLFTPMPLKTPSIPFAMCVQAKPARSLQQRQFCTARGASSENIRLKQAATGFRKNG